MITETVANRPEVDLLLCCARTSKTPETASRIRALVRDGVDWEYLLRLARVHSIAPLLYWHLDAAFIEDDVPESVLNHLRGYFRANNLRNLSRTRELLRILHTLETSKIAVVPFKGPVLAASVYKNFALREFGDLDILVRRQDVAKARELLTSLGYRPQYELSRAQEAAFLKYEREYTFVRDSGDIVELHWELAPRVFSFSLNTDHIWERLMQVSLGGETVPAFSPEDLLLFLCTHASGHLWTRLAWICDVAEVINAYEGMDWERLLASARATGSERILFLGLLLASELLGANLPKNILNKVRADAIVGALAEQVHKRIFREAEDLQKVFDEESSHFQPLHLQMLQRKRDRVRYYIRQGTAPILADWALRPLPAPLLPLYRIFRPIRLAGRYGRKKLRRVYD